MSTKKSAAELKVEYERALARAEQLKQKMKRATAAEEAKKKAELLQLVLEWAESYDAVGDIDGTIAWFQNKIEHIHVNDTIVEHFKKYAKEVTTIGDERISKQIILAGVFKRTYVEEEYGYLFLGGKEITQLSPKTEKYLSKRFIKSDMKRSLKLQRIQF